MIKVKIADEILKLKEKTSILEILNNYSHKKYVVAGIVNKQIKDLNYLLDEDCTLEFLTLQEEVGNRIYQRSLFLLMAKVIYQLFPKSKLSIEHSLSNGIYCEVHKKKPLNEIDLRKIEKEMKKLIEADLEIVRHKLTLKELISIFKKQGLNDKVKLLEQLSLDSWPVYELDGYYDYFFYNLVPSTGFLKKFALHYRMPGFVLLSPQKDKPSKVGVFAEQAKLANIFRRFEKWGEIINVENVSALNKLTRDNKVRELLNMSEVLQEKELSKIADKISAHIDEKRVILIAGPSSSGKTTFAKRLLIQLKVNGLKPVVISMDDYYIDRVKTPLDEEGNYDFESIKALDLALFNQHLLSLLQGEEVEMPIYNFPKGIREKRGKLLQIDENQAVIIEGIHGLNKRLTEVIPQENKYSIYVSALTPLNIDRHNHIPTSDNRLIRRIVRDHYFRNHSASETIELWPRVRKGEEKNIFPFQENADIMFNSALIYELAVLKTYATAILEKISKTDQAYYQAQRLLEILNLFYPISEDYIPYNSILREFIGNSCFSF